MPVQLQHRSHELGRLELYLEIPEFFVLFYYYLGIVVAVWGRELSNKRGVYVREREREREIKIFSKLC